MSKIICEIRYKEDSVEKIWSGSLFSVSIPIKANYSSIIMVNMDVVVARLFINFNRNKSRRASYYSKINTNIRHHTKFKNSLKLYHYLSLWRNSSNQEISLIDLCNSLGLSKSYSNTSNFKKHILEPSYQILKDFNDVWFDLDKSKIKKDSNNENIIELHVMNIVNVEIEQKKASQISDILTSHFDFTFNDFNEVDDIIKSVSKDKLFEKLSHLLPHIYKVKHKAEYTKVALRNNFKL